ncbi:hypothetical protein [Micromonospora sp. LOL_023]|uniref:hypothetical protein n=1 Tax=Micromonospora sp. LOL_023 TaxID=3345418 RepID=UPI003A87DB39
MALGDPADPADAVDRHTAIVLRDGWLRLPAEHRAAYLVDAARAHLNTGNTAAAGRWLVEADRVAPAVATALGLTR